jgi:hypothetical protein
VRDAVDVWCDEGAPLSARLGKLGGQAHREPARAPARLAEVISSERPLCEQGQHVSIDRRTHRLHDVIRKSHTPGQIVAVGVKDAEAGIQTNGVAGKRRLSAKDRVEEIE